MFGRWIVLLVILLIFNQIQSNSYHNWNCVSVKNWTAVQNDLMLWNWCIKVSRGVCMTSAWPLRDLCVPESLSLLVSVCNERLERSHVGCYTWVTNITCGGQRATKIWGAIPQIAATPCFIGKCCNLTQFMTQIIDITWMKRGPEDTDEVCVGMI